MSGHRRATPDKTLQPIVNPLARGAGSCGLERQATTHIREEDHEQSIRQHRAQP